MKKILITMLVAIIAIAATEAKPIKKAVPKKPATEQTVVKATEQNVAESAEEPVNTEEPAGSEKETKINDKVSITKDGIIVKDKDGKTIEVKLKDLNRIINNHLDDTLLSSEEIAEVENGNRVITVDEREIMHEGMRLADRITTAFIVGMVFIVFFSLLFYYMHRRRKYKTVDRAIQAGYPLPNEFFNKSSQRVPQQPTTVYVNQFTPPAPDPNAPQGAQPAPGTMPQYAASGNPLNNITDWSPFKSGISTTAAGLGLMFFFWVLGAQAIAALMLIVVLVGLGKLFITYQEQQSQRNFWQQQQWAQQAQQAQASQQPAAPQQPAAQEVPPMPETPPEFNR